MNIAGRKIGFIGIIEKDWVVTFKNMDVDLKYLNYKRTATRLAKKLREEQGCDTVIALTHMRLNHDVKLASQVPGIDLVLAGHDHFYKIETCEQTLDILSDRGVKFCPVVKSGSDFEDYTVIDMLFDC